MLNSQHCKEFGGYAGLMVSSWASHQQHKVKEWKKQKLNQGFGFPHRRQQMIGWDSVTPAALWKETESSSWASDHQRKVKMRPSTMIWRRSQRRAEQRFAVLHRNHRDHRLTASPETSQWQPAAVMKRSSASWAVSFQPGFSSAELDWIQSHHIVCISETLSSVWFIIISHLTESECLDWKMNEWGKKK